MSLTFAQSVFFKKGLPIFGGILLSFVTFTFLYFEIFAHLGGAPFFSSIFGVISTGWVRYLIIAACGIISSTFLVSALRTRVGGVTSGFCVLVIAASCGVGVFWNIGHYREIEAAEIYPLRVARLATLAELAASGLDSFPSAEVMQWIRLNSLGTVVYVSPRQLKAAGLAYHRLIGVARWKVLLVNDERFWQGERIADDQLLSFQVKDAPKIVRLDWVAASGREHLCALTSDDAITFLGQSKAMGCGVKK